MAAFRSLRELESFVRALPIPEERREVVADELTGHVMERVAGGTSETDALASLGDPALLERLVAPAERRFSPSIAYAARAAARVAAVVALVQVAGGSLYLRLPVRVAVAVHLGASALVIALALPRWARRASYEARSAFAIVSWALAALPALLVNQLFTPPSPAAVGPMLLALWFVPAGLMFATVPWTRPRLVR